MKNHIGDASEKEAGAPGSEEIEVTPAMIEAGARVFGGYDPRFESPADVVGEIYTAMLIASPGYAEHLRCSQVVIGEPCSQVDHEDPRGGHEEIVRRQLFAIGHLI